MNIINTLGNITRLFLDTSPVIYYIEKNPHYFSIVKPIFDYIDNGLLWSVTSPITLSECLTGTYLKGFKQSQKDFIDLIVYGHNVDFISIDHEQAQLSAELRAKYKMVLPDSFQIATALLAECDAFLTNDIELKRVTEIKVLVLDELRSDS